MTAGRPSTCLYTVIDCRVNIGTTISTFVIRGAGESATNYRQLAKEMVDLKSKLQGKLTDLKRQLAAAQNSLTYNHQHQDSVQEHRKATNDVLEQRNVARDKLKVMQQERDRWEAKSALHRDAAPDYS